MSSEEIRMSIPKKSPLFSLSITLNKVTYLGLKSQQIGETRIEITEDFARGFWHERTLSIEHFDERISHFRIRFMLEDFGDEVIHNHYPFHDIFSPEYEGLEHILRKILSYLPSNELFHSMTVISKHCLSAIRKIPLHDQIRVRSILTTTQFHDFLDSFPNVHSILLDGFIHDNANLFEANQLRVAFGESFVKPLNVLRKLEIKRVYRKYPEALINLCPNLEELIIQRIQEQQKKKSGWFLECNSTSEDDGLLGQRHDSLRVLKIFSVGGGLDLFSLDPIYTTFLSRCVNLRMVSCPPNYDFTIQHRMRMRNSNFFLTSKSGSGSPTSISEGETDEYGGEEDVNNASFRFSREEIEEKYAGFFEISLLEESYYLECFMDPLGLVWLIRYESGESIGFHEDFIVVEPLFHQDDRTCFLTKTQIVAKDKVLIVRNGGGGGGDNGDEGILEYRNVEIFREFMSGFSSTCDSFKVLRFSKNRSCKDFKIGFNVLKTYEDYETYEENELQARTSLLALPQTYPIRVSHEFDLTGLPQFETLYNGDRVLQKELWIHCFRFRVTITYTPNLRSFTVFIVSLHAREYIVTSSIRFVFNDIKREIDHAVFDGRGGYGWNDLSVDNNNNNEGNNRNNNISKGTGNQELHLHLFFVVNRIFNRDEYRIYTKEKQQRWSKIETLFYHKMRQKELEKELFEMSNPEMISPPPQQQQTEIRGLSESESSDSVDSLVTQQEQLPLQKCKKIVQIVSSSTRKTSGGGDSSNFSYESQRVMFELHGIRWVLSYHPNRGKFGRSAFFIRCEDLVGSYVLRIRWSLRGEVFDSPGLTSAVQDYFEGRVWGFDEIQLNEEYRFSTSSLLEVEVEIEILDIFSEERYFRWQRYVCEKEVVLNKTREYEVEIIVGKNPVQTESFVLCGVPYMMEFYSDGIDSLEHLSVILYHRLEIHFVVEANYRIFCINDDGDVFPSRWVRAADEHSVKFAKICRKDLTKKTWKVRVQVTVLSVECHSRKLPKLQDNLQVYSK